MSKNYYELLNLNSNADEGTIRDSIEQTNRKWLNRINAPDLNRRQEAEKMIQLLEEAEKVLLNQQERRKYDAELWGNTEVNVPHPQPQPTPTMEKDPSDVITEMLEEAKRLNDSGNFDQAFNVSLKTVDTMRNHLQFQKAIEVLLALIATKEKYPNFGDGTVVYNELALNYYYQGIYSLYQLNPQNGSDLGAILGPNSFQNARKYLHYLDEKTSKYALEKFENAKKYVRDSELEKELDYWIQSGKEALKVSFLWLRTVLWGFIPLIGFLQSGVVNLLEILFHPTWYGFGDFFFVLIVLAFWGLPLYGIYKVSKAPGWKVNRQLVLGERFFAKEALGEIKALFVRIWDRWIHPFVRKYLPVVSKGIDFIRRK